MPAILTTVADRGKIILASASPRRRELLHQIGVQFDQQVAEIDETPRKNESASTYVVRLALEKARAVQARLGDDEVPVLGADTVVACGRRVLPKAADEAQARHCLALLSGRRHRVYGAVCVIDGQGAEHGRLVMTAVMFKRLSGPEIDQYIEGSEWRGKAGAYAIQGAAAAFVPKIIGSYSNVVGLPLAETAALLRGLGIEGGQAGKTPRAG